MKTIILAILILIFSGCISQDKNQYLEGVQLSVGLFIPYNGSIYGIQAVNFISGKKILITTNQNFKIESEHSITNSFLGVENSDVSKVKIGL